MMKISTAAKLLTFLLILFNFNVEVFSKAIKITMVSGLNFPVGIQGDAAYTIPAGTSETSENASFNVTGDANRAFTITLPSSITLSVGTQTFQKIVINNFTSFPSGTGVLSGSGSRMLYVGARRAALFANQARGNYSGSFTVTVVY